jgi:signal transduction histidine kinase/CheY-like chemotaxis protein
MTENQIRLIVLLTHINLRKMKTPIPVWRLVAILALMVFGGVICNNIYAQSHLNKSHSFPYQNSMSERVHKVNIEFLFEDSRELIWGYDHAQKKLFVFDGVDFTYIDPVQDGDLGCLEGSPPIRAFENQVGQIWVLYGCGLYIYDVATNKMKWLNEELKEVSGQPILSCYNMTKGNDGEVHLATQIGVFEFSPVTKSFEYFDAGKNMSRKSSLIYAAFEDRFGNFYCANPEELIVQSDIKDTVINRIPFQIPLSGPPRGVCITFSNFAIFRATGLVNEKEINNGRDFRFTKLDYQSNKISLLHDDYPEFPPFIWIHKYGDLVLSADSLGNLYEFNTKKDRFVRSLNLFDFIPKTYSIYDLKVFKKLEQDIIWVMSKSSTYKITSSPVKFNTKDFLKFDPNSGMPIVRMQDLVKYQGNVYFKTFPNLLPIRNDRVPPVEINSFSLDWSIINRSKLIENPQHGLFGMLVYFEPDPGKIAPRKLSYYFFTKDSTHKESYKIHAVPPQNPSDYRAGIDIMDIATDKQGDIWIGAWTGLISKLHFYEKTVTAVINTKDSIERFSSGVRRVVVDNKGLIWVGYHSNGIDVFDSIKVDNFVYKKNDDRALSSNYITALYEDNKQRMWVGTERGINCINPERTSILHFFTRDGLFENTICGIVSDKNERIWVFTPKNISFFSPQKNRFYSYRISEDDYFFKYSKPFVDEDGYVFSETYRGVFFFHPDSVQTLDRIPKLYIKNLLVNNTNVNHHVFSSSAELKKEPYRIKLKHHQNSITINYGACEFYLPNEIQFAYLLAGYDRQWQDAGNSRTATFTKVPPGSYTFILKCANSHDVWSEEFSPIHITILPPWYWAWHSKSLYLLLFAGLLYAFYRFQLKRRLAQAEALRLRELDSVKTRLYTNITHEFRTPLTVILGMADKIEEAPRQWLREGVKTIRRNGRNLLRLVNQMLDLARLEGGALPLTMIQGDIVAHLKTMMEMYRSYADAKNITLRFEADSAPIIMDFDPDKIGDIVSNLLSNALKFTPAGGKVVVSSQRYAVGSMQYAVGSSPSPLPTAHRLLPTGTAHRLPPTADCLLLTVQDTGPGIAPEKLPYIFDRFYQADDSATRRGEGTGIGLALTHELVKLLGGSITVQSEPGQGTAFIVRLPVSNEAPLQEALPALQPAVVEMPAPQHAPSGRTPGKLPLALIVEDNADVTRLLVANLKDRYRIETAPNGRKGVEKAIKIIPDVIISDVMMPEMDGFELCRTLKEDMRSSHIPIVLLTARADVDSRIEGLEMGADAYLAKPFNQQELEVSLRKSLELRERLRERYAGGHVPDEPATAVFGRDDAFVQRLNELLHANYANPEISAKDIEKGMLMSSSQLLRKMKSLLNTTPQKYLRSYRLKQAKHLLETTDMKANEVGDAVGFGDQAYFTNAFSREFGMPPGAWREG